MPFCKNCKKKLSQDQFEKHFGLCSECFLTKSENYSKHNAHKTSNKSRRQRKKEILDQERAYTERLKQYRMKPLVERQTRKTTKS